MNNQEKFTTWLNKLNVRRANSQITSLYAVIFSTIFSILLEFIFLFVFLLFLILFFWNWKYVFWYPFDYVGGWQINFFSPSRFPETRLLFFRPNLHSFNEGVTLLCHSILERKLNITFMWLSSLNTLERFFWQYCPKKIQGKRKNKCMRGSCLEDWKTILHVSISNTFICINKLRFDLK